jgi:hypothetical protein
MALVLLVLAVAFHETDQAVIVPTWLVLLLLAMSIFLSTRFEEARLAEPELEDELFGYDFSQGYTSLERSTAPPPRKIGVMRLWIRLWRRKWQQRKIRIEAQEDLQVDTILEKLHSGSLASLTSAERMVLRRASARYRSRQSSS